MQNQQPAVLLAVDHKEEDAVPVRILYRTPRPRTILCSAVVHHRYLNPNAVVRVRRPFGGKR